MGTEYVEKHPFFQGLMDAAYAEWNAAGGTGEWWEFMKSQPEPRRMAVALGKLNQQVTNGGFLQWHDNGYSKSALEVLRYLREFGSETAGMVHEIVTEAFDCMVDDPDDGAEEYTDEESEHFMLESAGVDRRFYEVNEILLDELEEHFRTLPPSPEDVKQLVTDIRNALTPAFSFIDDEDYAVWDRSDESVARGEAKEGLNRAVGLLAQFSPVQS